MSRNAEGHQTLTRLASAARDADRSSAAQPRHREQHRHLEPSHGSQHRVNREARATCPGW